MLIALLLAASATQTDPMALSSDLQAIVARRGSMGDEQTVKKVKMLADHGDDSAAELIGELYSFGGMGVTRDPVKACAQFMRIATRRGDAAHNLARCYENGEGLAADPAKARKWYAKGAELGYAKSSCALGSLLLNGRGGPSDIAKGMVLCRTAAERGDPDAQTDLANYLLEGRFVARNIVEARKWYTLAAAHDQANALFVLGQIYWNGDGTPVDRNEAAKLWRRAWAGGRKDAAGLIAGDLFKRMVTTRDGKQNVDRSLLPEAIQWLERAAAEDPDPAKRKGFADTLATLKGS
jgi:uncharacterized protein